MEVRKWLEENGLGRYGDLFEANQIDAEALGALTDAHLKELGIPIGPRAKLLRALARSATPAQAPAAQAERRQLTVMFVDLVGSTALSGRLDPEDLRKVIRSYQGAVAAVVARYEGHLAQYLGDGVLAYFGYPAAHEDDAERAVRAALAILEAVAALRSPDGEPLAARIGVATGLVVVGDLIGEHGARERAVVGETPNLAARLQGLAAPGQAVVSERTRALIGGQFELRNLGPRQLKGVGEPVGAYSIVGLRAVESRFEAHRAGRVAAMVGRDHELTLLRQAWRKACSGAGQLVLLTGEAGIGKSRIVHALQDELAAEAHVRNHYQCSPYHADSALFPVVQHLALAAGIGPNDSEDEKLDRLEALFGSSPPGGTGDLALIAALLGIDAPRRYGPPPPRTPREQRAATFRALIDPLVAAARRHPMLLVVEDAHWIDPTTLELVERCLERVAASRVLIVVSARPDFDHDFGGGDNVTRLALGRLSRSQVAAIASRVARDKSLPPELLDEIVAKTDGVPLFVEEFTRTALESGSLRETRDAFVLEGPLAAMTVPTSLRDSLMARLDRLQPVKELAQTAACIGREFSYALLAAVSPLPPEALQDALARLIDAEMLFRRGAGQAGRYSFKHALVRDAAYESLLKENRQQIHARLAAALEAVPGTPPELIAQHASRAALAGKALEYWQKAGEEAMKRTAYKEAIAHLTQALALVESLGDERARQERRLLLLLTLGQASIPVLGYSHPETVAAFQRAQQIVEAMPGAPHRFPIFYAVWVALYVRAEQDEALDTARRMVDQAERDRNPGHLLTALRSLAMSQMITGAPALARQTFERAAQLAGAAPMRSREQRIATADRFANDPEIGTQVHFAYTLWCLGEIDSGLRELAEAIAAARDLGHAHSLCHALSYGAMLLALSGRGDEAAALNREGRELAGRHEFDMQKGYGALVGAYVLSLRGDLAGSVARMYTGFERLARAHAGTTLSIFHAVQAHSLAALGRHREAARHADIVRDELSRGSERYYWPECQRLLGDYLWLCAGTASGAVESAYAEALATAAAQRAKTWQMNAALSLAALWAERGERQRARDLLAPLRSGMAQQAQDLPAVRRSATLLDELSRAEP